MTRTKTNKRAEAVAKLIEACIVEPGIATCGPVRDYLGSVTEFEWQGSQYKLVFRPNNENPRCELEKT